MKTAEQWWNENCDSDDASGQEFWLISKEQIAEIQQDAVAAPQLAAFKAGMTEATKLNFNYSPRRAMELESEFVNRNLNMFRKAILSERDRKESL